MNFTINLATRVYVDFRKLAFCFALIAVMLFLWGAYSIYTIVENNARIAKFTQFKSKLSHGVVTEKVSESNYASFLQQVRSVNAILYKQSYDWLSLLANLERLVPEGLALRGIEPSEKGSILKLSGSARNFASIRKFIENLESSKIFSEIYLTDQAAVKEGDQKGINFTVTCKASNS